MKVKEIDLTANVAWSPSSQYPIYLATGTAAQQLDATFSTSAALEIYSLSLNKPGLAMERKASLSTSMRFHKIMWGSHGINPENPDTSGLIIGGTDNGRIFLYDAQKVLNEQDSLVEMIEKHTGTVRALDVNPFQANLLASGASDSEIFVWDLNNTASPMSPGAKSQPPDDISCLAWNRQVQHILASTCPGGRCVVWDLRKNEPIIKVTDHSSRMHCKVVAWHPEVATQMALASEDDHSPVIQMWDLRFATSPLKVLESHQRGILSIAWCPQDSDLLLSCGKDNRILCWNPNSAVAGGEVTYELPTSSQWCFDVQWCPRNPGLISTASFDGHVSVHSLMGGTYPDDQRQQQQQHNVASSFPGMDNYGQVAGQQSQQVPTEAVILKKPPKWLRRPVGANFAFGGKLVSFEHVKSQQPHQSVSKQVSISQVITETDFINRSKHLESAINDGGFVEFCSSKIAKSDDDIEKQMWNFLKVNFEKEPRNHFISLLGHDSHELTKKVALATGAKIGLQNGNDQGVNLEELAARMENINTDEDGSDINLGSGTLSPSVGSKTPSDGVGDGDGAAAFDAIAAGGTVEVENRTDGKQDIRPDSPYSICKDEDTNGLLSKALLTGNFEAAVEMCLHDDRLADAIILAIAGGPELLARTQRKYFKKNKSDISRLISSIVTRDLSDMVKCCELSNWKEVLTALLTYATAEEFPTLCNSLGSRLETEGDEELVASACLCYICAGNVEKLVTCWCKVTPNGNSALGLQDLVEKVMILREAVAQKQGYVDSGGSVIAQKLSSYAQLLASQGSLTTAINYLRDSNEPVVANLLERLYKAQGQAPSSYQQQNRAQVKPTVSQVSQSQGLNSFKTTTTSSRLYYNSQVSSQAQQNNTYYTQTSPATQKPTNIYSKQGLNHPAYPKPQMPGSSAQPIYYQPSATISQPTYPNATPTSFYNPTSYNQQPAPITQVQNKAPSQPHQPTPLQPTQMVSQQPISSLTQSRPKQEQGAWNDPPPVKQKEKPTYVAPVPITAPIIGGAESAAHPGMNQGAPGGPTGYGQPQGYNAQMYNPQQAKEVQATEIAQKAEPVEKKEAPRAPIPAEHQVLNQTFESLKNRCINAVGLNPQIKRKLDDVTKKLNALYDKLCENALSPNILQGLHQIAHFIGAMDYQNGLEVYKQLVSSGNFSEISTFMPGLKVLMQVATQLHV
ncbi:protein transport protein Sec31A-like [Anneissia japonica]|uniref:protein transport protein Sec31A-like n=1 Tax=Anneissia japonica TaxID=1529436 RepID=UPI001425694E|nr:protein transport protein Sec31A-like [Anneissia japonica]